MKNVPIYEALAQAFAAEGVCLKDAASNGGVVVDDRPQRNRTMMKRIQSVFRSGRLVGVMRWQKRVEDARKRAYAPRIHQLRKKFLKVGWIAGTRVCGSICTKHAQCARGS